MASAPLPRAVAVAPMRVALPPLVFGTSALGNLYVEMPEERRVSALRAALAAGAPTLFDCAGKYGAGLALEALGRGLRALGAAPADVVIGNKLGWRRAPLVGAEPTFERGAWVGLTHDAVQDISAAGIRRCWDEGRRLIGAPYRVALASVHDPDEYLAGSGEADRARRLADVLDAYAELAAMKRAGEVAAIGVGAKDWRVVATLAERVDLDWAMLACAPTVMRHPEPVLRLVADLAARGVAVIASAVFHGGFLVGGAYCDYRRVDALRDHRLVAWRARFHRACRDHDVAPDAACVAFVRAVPGVASIALNCADPAQVAAAPALTRVAIPPRFWLRLKDDGLIARDLDFLG